MIEHLLAPNPSYMTGAGTNTWFVHDGGGSVLVIDPGPDDPRHVDAILETAATLGSIQWVLVTHRHSDHLPAAYDVCRRTGASLHGHPQLPGVQVPLADGSLLPVGGASVQVLHRPGHTDDSVCVWIEAERALFTGDLVAGQGTVIVDDQPGGLARYMRSIEQLLELGPCSIYPGHGPVVQDGPAKLQEYLEHRRAREKQVLSGLAHGGATVDSLVASLYPDVAPALRPMAARNVRAALDKLSGEGRVRQEGGRWQVVG